jgi:hypothetical protein
VYAMAVAVALSSYCNSSPPLSTMATGFVAIRIDAISSSAYEVQVPVRCIVRSRCFVAWTAFPVQRMKGFPRLVASSHHVRERASKLQPQQAKGIVSIVFLVCCFLPRAAGDNEPGRLVVRNERRSGFGFLPHARQPGAGSVEGFFPHPRMRALHWACLSDGGVEGKFWPASRSRLPHQIPGPQ